VVDLLFAEAVDGKSVAPQLEIPRVVVLKSDSTAVIIVEVGLDRDSL
jgi:hypothetical protein